MSKILILANNHVGLFKFRKELIKSLLDLGNKVYISLPYGPFVDDLVDLGCTYVETNINRRGLNPLQDIFLYFKYYRILKDIRPDLTITYTVKPNVYGGVACRLTKSNYAVNITGLGTSFQKAGLLKSFITFLYKLACKDAKVVFFENEFNLDIFTSLKIIPTVKAKKLNGAGVNTEDYPITSLPNSSNTIFLFIGRIMEEKGINEFFQVAKTIKKSFEHVEFHVIGEFEDDYSDLIRQLVSSNTIKYHGYQSDVKPFIKNSHCIVLPSYHEGMSNTLLEGASMGRPLITSNINGCKEAVVDGETGFLVNKKDHKDLCDKVKKFIELSYIKKKEMGLASRRHIESEFDKKDIVSKTIGHLYHD